ncbi:MAG: S8 family serine peptidase [Deltaproteobacteria bacterium]|nr:S8 family serine peptidase [Deltaproteobacteria bacterium]
MDVLALLLLGSPLVTSVSSFEVNVALGVAFEPNTVVLKSNPGSSPQHLQGEARARGCGTPRRLSPGRPYFVARCSGAVGMHDLIASWSSSQAIAWAEPNYAGVQHATPDDLDAEQWYHLNEGQIVYPSNQTFRLEGLPDADIDTVEAWDLTTGDPSVVIAIVDSGVDVEHPELVDHIWTNPGEDCTNGIDDDGNGYVDDCHGWDTGDDDPDASVVDMVDAPECGRAHGTQVAGTASATGDNGIDVVGVDWHARIMPLAVATTSTTGCRAYDAAAVEALLYAIDNGADVVNISLGYPVRQSMLWQEVARSADAAGALIVTSAGNLGREVDDNSAYPQSLEFENLIVVGNTTNRDELWSGELSPSSYGPRVDIAAPNVAHCRPSSAPSRPEPTRALRRSLGTSQSAPLVAGAWPWCGASCPELSPADTKRAVLEGA